MTYITVPDENFANPCHQKQKLHNQPGYDAEILWKNYVENVDDHGLASAWGHPNEESYIT